jgi:hypothetical protein
MLKPFKQVESNSMDIINMIQNSLVLIYLDESYRANFDILSKRRLRDTHQSFMSYYGFTAAVSITHARTSVTGTNICFKHSSDRTCSSTTTSTERKMHATAKCPHSFEITKHNYKVHKFTANLFQSNRNCIHVNKQILTYLNLSNSISICETIWESL